MVARNKWRVFGKCWFVVCVGLHIMSIVLFENVLPNAKIMHVVTLQSVLKN